MRVAIWDSNMRQMRYFEIIPLDVNFSARCGKGLHQFNDKYDKCSCGVFSYKDLCS